MILEGKSAIVTGAAQGIGRGIAERLCAEGASVLVADLNGDAAQETAATIAAQGARCFAEPLDVTDRAGVRRAVQRAVAELGGLDVMVNNAGFNHPQPFLEISEEVWEAILRVNALGVLIGTQEAARAMIKLGGGKIVNTASIAGRTGFADFAAYSASKSAVISLTQSAARALAPHGITVNAIGPGVVDTPLWEKLDQDLYEMGAADEPGSAMASMADQILLGRVATPADVAGTVVYLASELSDYLTGQTINIDGGMVLS